MLSKIKFVEKVIHIMLNQFIILLKVLLRLLIFYFRPLLLQMQLVHLSIPTGSISITWNYQNETLVNIDSFQIFDV